jgi:UrcA family protein
MLMHQSRSAPSRVIGLALAIAAASLIADIAYAKEAWQASTVVNFRDLDLSQSTDAQRLYGRLQYASKQVCSSYDTRQLSMRRRYDACYDAALGQAVKRVNEPKLTALHTAEPRIRVADRT